jgi:hypothetical protein
MTSAHQMEISAVGYFPGTPGGAKRTVVTQDRSGPLTDSTRRHGGCLRGPGPSRRSPDVAVLFERLVFDGFYLK